MRQAVAHSETPVEMGLMVSSQTEKSSESGGAPLIQSLSRGLSVLGQFTADSKTLSLSELSRRTGLHKATVHRFAKTLEAEGFLTSVDAGVYSVGPVWAMSLFALGSENVFSEILAYDLRELAGTTLETVALGVRRGDWVHIAHVLPPGRSFVPVLPPGHLHPLHATWNVHSQVFVAFGDDDLQRRMLATPQTRYTQNTVVDAKGAAAKFEQVRREGVAYDRQEFREGTCAVGVPVHSRGKVVAALALVMPVERFNDESVGEYIRQLRGAADSMGSRLDGSTES
jgi:DNA-binding IclR family transcriptional regulator